MNALTTLYRLFPTRPVASAPVARAAVPATPAPVVELAEALPARRPDRYRARDFGTGYGRSSGYGRDSSYTAARSDASSAAPVANSGRSASTLPARQAPSVLCSRNFTI